MLVSWGLRALLSGLSGFVWPSTASFPAGSSGPPSQHQDTLIDVYNRTALGLFVEEYESRHAIPVSTPARTVPIDPSWPSNRPLHHWRHPGALRQRQEKCSITTPVVCPGANGDGPVCSSCSSCCPDGSGGFNCCQEGFKCCGGTSAKPGFCCPDNGEACGTGSCLQPPLMPGPGLTTVFTTTAITHTVTTDSPPRTVGVFSTITQTLTFVDPAFKTRTETVTVTSFLPRAKRMVPVREERSEPTLTLNPLPVYDALESRLSTMGVKVVRQAAAAVVISTRTSTVTEDLTTTVGSGQTVTSTRFNTVFVTVTAGGEDAPTTVFVTTTIFVPDSAGGTTSDSPATGTSRAPSSNVTPPSTPTITSASTAPTSLSTAPTSQPTTTAFSGSSTIESQPSPTPATTRPPDVVTPTPPAPPLAFGNTNLTSDQIAGVSLAIIFFVFLLVVAAFLARRFMQRRRSRLAAERQQLTPSSGPAGSVPDGMAARHPSPADPNDVRIVIRQAPRGRGRDGTWPVPPGHSGPAYSMFIEGTTGETTPHEQGAWSVVSDFGSVSPMGGGSASGRPVSNVPSSGVFSGNEEVAATTQMASTEGRPSFSSNAPVTRLQPPPPSYGLGRSPGASPSGSTDGVGRAF